MEILTKENLVGAKIAPTAISRAFTLSIHCCRLMSVGCFRDFLFGDFMSAKCFSSSLRRISLAECYARLVYLRNKCSYIRDTYHMCLEF